MKIKVWTEEKDGEKAWLCSQDNQRYISTLIDDTTEESRGSIKRHREYIAAKRKQCSDKK